MKECERIAPLGPIECSELSPEYIYFPKKLIFQYWEGDVLHATSDGISYELFMKDHPQMQEALKLKPGDIIKVNHERNK